MANTCERINCGYYWKEEWEDFPSCKFHGFGPAPCEVDDEYGEDEEDENPSCATCGNADQDTTDKVACCNCCEDYSFYTRAF